MYKSGNMRSGSSSANRSGNISNITNFTPSTRMQTRSPMSTQTPVRQQTQQRTQQQVQQQTQIISQPMANSSGFIDKSSPSTLQQLGQVLRNNMNSGALSDLNQQQLASQKERLTQFAQMRQLGQQSGQPDLSGQQSSQSNTQQSSQQIPGDLNINATFQPRQLQGVQTSTRDRPQMSLERACVVSNLTKVGDRTVDLPEALGIIDKCIVQKQTTEGFGQIDVCGSSVTNFLMVFLLVAIIYYFLMHRCSDAKPGAV
ncbi:hypothetical protein YASMINEVIRUS_1176 [Yasminevirus sp. GU-2018]|uniref:Uncharacterized protein n=1 Tax=Yasminevirus sp. GU-2018 TaxID=2420051 RepID=A0A5K0UAA1_9VIRU|nr:hypothetical protein YASMINEVIRUS_1176 [Yasminevirus sp. GU-2018]